MEEQYSDTPTETPIIQTEMLQGTGTLPEEEAPQTNEEGYTDISTESFLPVYNVSKQPYQLAFAAQDFHHHFLKGAKWSTDGSQLLSCADDRRLRVYNLPSQFYTGDFSQPIPEMKAATVVKEGGTIYDYSWYPLMNNGSPETCCFITSSTSTPIHLWNSIDGDLIATYRLVNHLDELDTAYSLSFTPDGCRIYAGFSKQVYVFDVSSPGRQTENFKTHKRRETGQTGIISCFDFLPSQRMFAAGSYSKSIGVYDERNNSPVMILEGHTGGVTHLRFSPDSNLLYSGARKDNELLVWDMRSPGQILAVLNRDVRTNQRMYFDLDPSGRYVCSGNHSGAVSVWDMHLLDLTSDSTEQQLLPQLTFSASSDCVNSTCFHPSLAMLVTCSGQRSFRADACSSDSDQSDEEVESRTDNSLRFWWIGE